MSTPQQAQPSSDDPPDALGTLRGHLMRLTTDIIPAVELSIQEVPNRSNRQALRERIAVVKKAIMEVSTHSQFRSKDKQTWDDLIPKCLEGFRFELPPRLEMRILSVIKAIRDVNSSLPHDAQRLGPSQFGRSSKWVPEQTQLEDLLCFRPGFRKGVPMATLCQAFRQYLVDVASHEALPRDQDGIEALISASRLAATMADPYPNERTRASVITTSISSLFQHGDWKKEYRVHGLGLKCSIDDAFFNEGHTYPVVLREDKNGLGASGDPHLQLAKAYQIFAKYVEDKAPTTLEAQNLRENGVPTFLVSFAGPYLAIFGGFYDGASWMVEILGSPLSLLPDSIGTSEQDKLARALYALRRGARTLEQAQVSSPSLELRPAVPRIYQDCKAIAGGVVCKLKFESCIPQSNGRHEVFLGTWTPQGSTASRILVKLAGAHYGDDVQRYLAPLGYAPQLHAVAVHQGAPRAFVMEWIPNDQWASADQIKRLVGNTGWRTLFRPAICESLKRIVQALEDRQLVHGNLNPGNVLVFVDKITRRPILDYRDGSASALVKLISFGSAGKGGSVYYPAGWSPYILEQYRARAIEVGHDRLAIDKYF